MDFAAALREKGLLLFDGATGTQLMEAGIPVGNRSCWEHPAYDDTIEAIQRGYRDAGADILTADTFMAKVSLLEDAATVSAVVGRAVKAAKKHAENGFVALSVGVESSCRMKNLIAAGAQEGADVVLVETMLDLSEALEAVKAAKEACSLPVLCTLTSLDGKTVGGIHPRKAIRALEDAGAFAAGFNCSPDALGADALFAAVGEAGIPLIAQPSAGLPEKTERGLWYPIGPEDFAERVANLRRYGVRLFGGCCGTTPSHIRALRGKLS